MSEAIVVACIGSVGVVLAALFQSMRRENKTDHGVVSAKLDMLAEGHARIEHKVDTHINDHAKGDL